ACSGAELGSLTRWCPERSALRGPSSGPGSALSPAGWERGGRRHWRRLSLREGGTPSGAAGRRGCARSRRCQRALDEGGLRVAGARLRCARRKVAGRRPSGSRGWSALASWRGGARSARG
ncbi:unnamed protein product, partial [Laminaria digitata]